MSRYAFGKTIELGFDAAVERAVQALEAGPQIRAMPPCSVGVRQDVAGALQVEFLDPDAVFGLVGRPEVAPIAQAVSTKLQRVLAGI
jgi:hypothetical protein